MDQLVLEDIETLLLAHRAELKAYVERHGGAAVSAEDLVQQAAVRAVAGADQLRDREAGRAWLFTITRRLLVDRLRQHRALAIPLSDDEVSPELAEEFGCGCVLANIHELRSEHTEILLRVVVGGASASAVATELGITTNAAQVRLHRARVALREQLLAHCGTDSLRACLDCSCAERGCCG